MSLVERERVLLGRALTSISDAIVKRATVTDGTPWQACPGCSDPSTVNNKFFFAIFAVLAVGIVLTGVWFFFFAKNGGFRYEKGDYEDFKTVILRRKGADGKSLPSSKSTMYGPGTVYGEELNARHERLRWAALSVVARDENGRLGILAKRGPLGTHSCTYRDDFTNYDGKPGVGRKAEMSEVGSLPDWSRAVPEQRRGKSSGKDQSPAAGLHHPVPGAFDIDLEAGGRGTERAHGKRYKDRDVSAYKHERVARVGGMNREPEWSGSDVSSSAGHAGNKDARHERAERRAATEAERMERQWRREARRAADSLAREHAGGDCGSSRSGSASPIKRGGTSSPVKRTGREYSFSRPEVHGSTQASSYMDAYRPRR